ncbi:hypothetical protein [Paraliobacillus zengyii]|uniref:hypothetical protein n=1 Tax=Paraliobacillus zengyii TaxID=2213194 RepID=UPI000DD4E7E5|nr:hypothetical protein [Paraliobacillus zengyii]
MKMVSRIREKYRRSNKLFLSLRVFFSLISVCFAVRILFLSISGLVSSDYSTDFPNLLLFGMYLPLGLSFAVQVVEMIVTKKKEHFTLLLFGAIFVLAVSGLMLWFETV